MNKYVNAYKYNSEKVKSTTLMTFGIIGFMFWGFVSFAVLAYSGIEHVFLNNIILLFLVIHILLILKAIKMKKFTDMVYFYARYFEGDLDGYIFIANMVNLAGKDEFTIYRDLNRMLKKGILTNFFIRDYNGRKQIVLESMIKKCECKNCGAIIDKRIFFTGVCPYCNGSDIFAETIEK